MKAIRKGDPIKALRKAVDNSLLGRMLGLGDMNKPNYREVKYYGPGELENRDVYDVDPAGLPFLDPALILSPAGDLEAIGSGLGQIAGGDVLGGGANVALGALSVLLPGTLPKVKKPRKGYEFASKDPKFSESIKREKDWLNSEEYIRRKQNATGKPRESIISERDKILKNVDEVQVQYPGTGAEGAANYSRNSNSIRVLGKGERPHAEAGAIDHELKHAASEVSLSRLADDVAPSTLGSYRGYPTIGVGKSKLDEYNPMAFGVQYHKKPYEQQVRFRRFMDLAEKQLGVPRGQKLTTDQVAEVYNSMLKDPELADNFSDVINLIQGAQMRYGSNTRKVFTDALNKSYLIPALASAGYLSSRGQQEN